MPYSDVLQGVLNKWDLYGSVPQLVVRFKLFKCVKKKKLILLIDSQTSPLALEAENDYFLEDKQVFPTQPI